MIGDWLDRLRATARRRRDAWAAWAATDAGRTLSALGGMLLGLLFLGAIVWVEWTIGSLRPAYRATVALWSSLTLAQRLIVISTVVALAGLWALRAALHTIARRAWAVVGLITRRNGGGL